MPSWAEERARLLVRERPAPPIVEETLAEDDEVLSVAAWRPSTDDDELQTWDDLDDEQREGLEEEIGARDRRSHHRPEDLCPRHPNPRWLSRHEFAAGICADCDPLAGATLVSARPSTRRKRGVR